jgi:hypothetical protein
LDRDNRAEKHFFVVRQPIFTAWTFSGSGSHPNRTAKGKYERPNEQCRRENVTLLLRVNSSHLSPLVGVKDLNAKLLKVH